MNVYIWWVGLRRPMIMYIQSSTKHRHIYVCLKNILVSIYFILSKWCLNVIVNSWLGPCIGKNKQYLPYIRVFFLTFNWSISHSFGQCHLLVISGRGHCQSVFPPDTAIRLFTITNVRTIRAACDPTRFTKSNVPRGPRKSRPFSWSQ